MKILICGDPSWKNLELISDLLEVMKPSEIIISNDSLSKKVRDIAEVKGIPIKQDKTYNLLGYNPDVVLALHQLYRKRNEYKRLLVSARKQDIPIIMQFEGE